MMRLIWKFLKFTALTLGGVAVIAVLVVSLGNRHFLGGESPSNVRYLQRHSEVLGSGAMQGSLFDAQLREGQVFLLGEIHGYAGNQDVDRQLFEYLNRTLGVTHYVAEMSASTAAKLNAYLGAPTKQDALLREVIGEVGQRIPQQASVQLFDKWSALYDHNRSLPNSARITVVGIDTAAGEDHPGVSRDEAMAKNFLDYVARNPVQNAKFYGFFGFFHALQRPSTAGGRKPLAQWLNEAGFRTVSFVSYTLDSAMYLPKNPQVPTPPNEQLSWINADGPFMLVKGIKDLKAASQPGRVTLFKLNSNGSPYAVPSPSPLLASVKSRMFGENIVPLPNSATTDYFQYVVLLRNSAALTALP